jgi:hypothetical protein
LRQQQLCGGTAALALTACSSGSSIGFYCQSAPNPAACQKSSNAIPSSVFSSPPSPSAAAPAATAPAPAPPAPATTAPSESAAFLTWYGTGNGNGYLAMTQVATDVSNLVTDEQAGNVAAEEGDGTVLADDAQVAAANSSPVDTVAMLAYVTAGNDIAAGNFSASTQPLNQAAAYENQVTAAINAYESSTGS